MIVLLFIRLALSEAKTLSNQQQKEAYRCTTKTASSQAERNILL
jgi:hypothetical protein